METVLITVVSVTLGALLGLAVWMLRDVRAGVKETQQVLTDFRLEAQTSFVRRDDYRADLQGVQASLNHLDDRLDGTEKKLDRLAQAVESGSCRNGGCS